MLHYYRFKDALNLFNEGKLEEGRRVLAELQASYISMADELGALKAQVQEYEDVLYLARNLVYDGAAYWLMTGSLRQGPFCRACYAERGRLVRLLDVDGVHHCPACEERQAVPGAVLEAPRARVLPFSH